MIKLKFSLKRTAYIVCFFSLASLFALVYYGSYYYAINNMKSDNIITKNDIISENPELSGALSNNVSKEAGNDTGTLITRNTGYTEEIYNIDNNLKTSESTNIPVEYIGLNREQVVDYLSEYIANSEDKTLVNIQLISFSAQSIVVRKTVRDISNVYNYFVKSKDGVIVIYKSDKETVYFETGISIDNYNDEQKEKINKGFYIETIHDLYNYLEDITS